LATIEKRPLFYCDLALSARIEQKIRDSITNFNFSATQKNIALTLELPEESIRLTSDARLLTQALHNLLSNAIKYTPEGNVTLRAQVNDSEVVIIVTDTGIGIPADALPHIFERFYRVKEHSIIFEGTGLGLSIAQTIILQHKGTLTVDSEPGRGSTFTIRLPR
jgi:signal transduction histidine kinase